MDLLLNANREKFQLLSSQYTENLEAVVDLQGTLIENYLPSVADELELDVESIQWAKEWLNDTCERVFSFSILPLTSHFLEGSLFRILRVRYPGLLSADLIFSAHSA
jgi:hypothetical protein